MFAYSFSRPGLVRTLLFTIIEKLLEINIKQYYIMLSNRERKNDTKTRKNANYTQVLVVTNLCNYNTFDMNFYMPAVGHRTWKKYVWKVGVPSSNFRIFIFWNCISTNLRTKIKDKSDLFIFAVDLGFFYICDWKKKRNVSWGKNNVEMKHWLNV